MPFGWHSGSRLSFNSKLVRLEGNIVEPAASGFVAFQFQIGAIRSVGRFFSDTFGKLRFNSKLVRLEASYRYTRCVRDALRSFNSKLVRLEDDPNLSLGLVQTSFNSKLVRLEAQHYGIPHTYADGFQFQIGAIRR